MRLSAIVLVIIGLVLLVSSVSATIDTQFLPSTYIPYQYEVLLIGLGFTCWFLMKYFSDLEVVFGLAAVIIFGAAAYMAAYMCIENVFYDGTTVTYTQLVTPEPVLQIILIACFLFAVIIEVYVLFLRTADKKTDEGLSKGGK
jgi:uncharacterized membrane protein